MVTAEDDEDTVRGWNDGDRARTSPDGSAPVHPRVGVLLVGAWLEPGESSVVRARLFTTEDDSPVPTTWATAAGDGAICDELLRWLEHLRHRAGGSARGPNAELQHP